MNYKLKTVGVVALVGVSLSALLFTALTNLSGMQLQQIDQNSKKMLLADEMLDTAFNKYIPQF